MKLYVIGLGPGDEAMMTAEAFRAIEDSSCIVGYGVYIDLIRHFTEGKEILSTPMKQELARCRMAVEAAASGKTVAMVSSGDAGIYGMAGLIYEVLGEYPDADVQVKVIPGITAACSAAAVLGAPLTHDFAVISLSDLLTPWEDIEKRLRLAAEAGFVLAIYNPASKKRADYLKKACRIVSEHLPPQTPCGVVRNIGRAGQESAVLTLKELEEYPADMFTTVIIGNRTTKVVGGKLVTPRGYRGVDRGE